MNRRKFVEKSMLFGCSIAVLSSCKAKNSLTAEFVKNPLDIEKTRDFVYYAHSDLALVKKFVNEFPHIVNSTVDWGDGDFESALGAASHVGNIDIANFLIESGARADIFTLAMLGLTDNVITYLKKFPATINSIGPHGFTLLHHSEIGVKSEGLSNYLINNGLTDKFIKTFKK
ncbi:hypothetical protein [Winogradskyella haliclonae]|uniref:Ankyrin repeat domain-containing protein n=1 Tax=Winogradskyella haliclonae TaxID=2048558 RepID=A0ABQ2BYN1_9FLAO|nr:hypothetical protein [Winogradskyella haliclonae]GGI57600.1 hypothetical protein GCM10011444_19090 [Winogradskyella haliclonae]